MYGPKPHDPRTIIIPKGYGKIRFGRVELANIALAVGVLTFAFTYFINQSPVFRAEIAAAVGAGDALPYTVVVGFLAVLTGFLLHELMHKILAQRNGVWAEFRAYPLGLLMAIVFAFAGFFFAAPGAVNIMGMINKRQNGIISVAGPLANLAVGTIFTIAYLFIGGLPSAVSYALFFVGSVNLFFAAFNLLPIPPFDGFKVATWNIGVYLVAMGASIVMVLVSLGYI